MKERFDPVVEAGYDEALSDARKATAAKAPQASNGR
jgi:hypothetical protein